METNRLPVALHAPVTHAARLLIAFAAISGLTPSVSSAQNGDQLATSNRSSVNYNISHSEERIEMLIKTSRILTLEERIPKFQVHNEEVLNATPISQNQIQISGKQPGTTQLNIWDTNDKLYQVDVIVLADAREVEGILASQLPLASLRVMPLNNSAIVSGHVTSADDVDRAVAIVEQFYTQVVNNIKVVGVQQILLHTKIMEVSRTRLRQLGIDWSFFDGTTGLNSGVAGLLTAANSTVPATSSATNRILTNGGEFVGLLDALRQNDLVKLLAEPTVVATHGRPARFTVGGRVPYIVISGNGTPSIAYEDYGTTVDFLPFVVGPGRVKLEVRPEVSEVDESRGVTLGSTVVPAFTQRYVETAVEMQAGQTFAIAGLLQSRVEASIKSTPFFGELPLVGAAFRSVRERKNEVELLITVTPEIVDAMDPHEVPPGGPGLNTMSPSDHELYLNGHIEVPNLMGSHCDDDAGLGFYDNGYAPSGAATSGTVVSGQIFDSNNIVPGPSPEVVGEGVTIMSPLN